MAAIAVVVYVLLLLYFFVLLARFGLDVMRMLRRGFRPRGFGLVLAEGVYSVTDPPMRLLRRIIPPMRIGGAALDFSWSVLMLLVIILISVTALGFMN
ncbi:YggT family protein [Galbitalea soli]|uniref:YggT family protein n=1 Tax=Galbitalea soli TaxID=1268042 RepID=A0A7C9TN69_9MICO|nr:YggT family protein [Galbitalea soli]NEM90018.1 YggT family protein [Galbitalea soli]